MKKAKGVNKKNPNSDITRSCTFVNPYNYKCPRCGKNMQYTSMFEATGHGPKKKSILYCEKDNMIANTWKAHSGNVHLISTPADLLTRERRIECHFYFDIICNSDILQGKDSAYLWLTDALGYAAIGKQYCKHIGEMDDMLCRKTIELCLNLMLARKDKLNQKIRIYDGPNSYTKSRKDLIDIINKINDPNYTVDQEKENKSEI